MTGNTLEQRAALVTELRAAVNLGRQLSHADVDEIEAALRLPAGEGWQPIETAPRDGRAILVCAAGFRPAVAWWQDDRGCFDNMDGDNFPAEDEAWDRYRAGFNWPLTHWKPLPAAPRHEPGEGLPREAGPNVEQPCNEHPDAPHGFDRTSSHSLGRYVCDCEGWTPDEDQSP